MPSSVINSDDGVISGTSGLKSTGGDDGVLVFQSKGTETARINTDKQIVAAAGTASLPIYSTTGDVNTGIYFPAADTIAFAEGGAEAMRIDSGGNVAIGATSVTSGVRLDVVSADSSQSFIDVLKVKTTNTGDVHPAILFENNRGSTANAFKIAMDADAAAGTSSFLIRMKDSGGTFNNQIILSNNGLFRFNSGYGSVATAYGCRAWVNFDGTGTPAIREDGNVSSITDNGTGNYTVNFTTAMPDANYSAVTASNYNAGGNASVRSNTYSTSAVQIMTHYGTATVEDSSIVNVAVFR